MLNYRDFCNLAAILAVSFFAIQSAVAGTSDFLAEADKLEATGDLRAAEIELKNAVRTDPQNMSAHYRLAVVELSLGNAAAAEYEARAANLGGYDPDRSLPLVAKTYLAQHKYKELIRDFAGTDGSATQRAGVLVARGTAQIATGNMEGGIASFDQAQELAPDDPDVLVAKTKYLISKHDYPAADALIERALKLAPKQNDVRFTKARLLEIEGKPQDALELLGDMLTDAPAFLSARLERAGILLAQNQEAAAKTDVDFVLKLQPRSTGAVYLKAALDIKDKDFESANTDIQKLSGSIADIPRGYFTQALIQYNLRQFVQAEDAARRFVTRNPDDLAGQKLLAVIELALGHPAQAVNALEKFEGAGTADAGALDALGKAYLQLGRTAEAVQAFDAAVKLAPKDPGLQFRLGASRIQSGDTTEGLSDVEQSFDLAPSAPAAELLIATELAAGHWQEARLAAEKLKDAQPKSPIPGTLIAVTQIAQFDLDGAKPELASLAQTYPDYVPAKLNLARVLELQGDLSQAEAILNTLLAQNSTSAAALSRLVPLLLSEGKPDAAVAAVERAHAALPKDQGITIGLIDLYTRLGRNDPALTLARQEPGTNNPADVPLIAARARAELAAGLKTDGAQTFRRAIEAAPKRIDLRRALASISISAGDFTAAREVITQALSVNPRSQELLDDLLAIDVKSSGIDAALATARQLQKANGDAPIAPALIGDAYLEAHQYAEAAEAYEAAMQQASSPVLEARLARAKLAAGNPGAAIDSLKGWLKDHPKDMAMLELLASYELAQQRFGDAREHFEQVVAQQRPEPIALNNLAWLYQQINDPRALELAERAYLLAPALPQVSDTLGWILVQQGKATTAVELLKEASARNPTDLEMQYHLAVALNDTGDREKALELLKTLTGDKVAFDDKASAAKLFADISKH